jgi:hypothetical protein
VVILLILLYLAVIAFEVPPLVKQKQTRELFAFTVLMALAIAISLPMALGIQLPNPTDLLVSVLGPLSEAVFGEKPHLW